MKAWITAVAAASLLSAMAMALTPPGRVRQVTRLACGLLCALALVSPVLELDFDTLGASLAEYEQQSEEIVQETEDEEKMLNRTYIEEEYAAYILAKATEAEIDVKAVSVSARWDEDSLLWYPWQVQLDAVYDEGLSEVIEGELGIPRQRQEWRDDEQ